MNLKVTFSWLLRTFVLFCLAQVIWGCQSKDATTDTEYQEKTRTDSLGNEYRHVTNDPYDARIYELDNGLKVYLTVDRQEPRVQTLIAVRAGSASEQRETTGLAHYLEHMMFKGSAKMGTKNWEKEKPYLEKISKLYEQRKATDDSAEKRRIYHQIDSLSQKAAQYAIPNEYDKIISNMGGKYTNAFTSKDRTVYMNNIPSNAMDKWIRLERERFRKMVLRLFHTELETVFEEFNTSQDSDYRKARQAMNKALFKGHPYKYSTIGKPEHLKNPSMENVHAFKDEYYAPNNLAICLSGDMNPAETFAKIKKHWGDMKPNDELEEDKDHGKAEPIDGPVEKTVQGPEAERVYVGYRFPANDTNYKMVALLDELLYNGQSGLIDLNLKKQQKVLEASCYSNFYRDYGKLRFYGQAREDQDLEEVKGLLLDQVEKLKKGDFPDWMLEAAIRNKKKERIEQRSSNWKAFAFTDAFIKGKPWIKQVNYLEELGAVSKKDLTEFAQNHLDKDRVVVYKRSGKDTSSTQMPKPPITSVDINRDEKSGFREKIESMGTNPIEPVFLDYDERISTTSLESGIKFNYIENEQNGLFTLYYMIDAGKHHDPKLSLAFDYLEKLGTDQFSPSELEQEFYKLASDFNVFTRSERSYVRVQGLKENFEETVQLLEHLLANAQPDSSAYAKLVDNIIQERKNRKKSKRWNYRAMLNYGRYGPKSGFTNKLPGDSLRAIAPGQLVNKIHSLFDHKHYILYHGIKPMEKVTEIVKTEHAIPDKLEPLPSKRDYPMRPINGDSVFLVDYDMVQARSLLISRGQNQDTTLFPYAKIYNNYYGGGLSSIMFQEIRESKGLAYSVYSSFSTPDTGKHHSIYAYVGTQTDKLETATNEISNLLNNMTESPEQFESAKTNLLKDIATDRTTGASIFFSYLNDRKEGFNQDKDKYIYDKVEDMTMKDLEQFFNDHVKGDTYDLLIMTDTDQLKDIDLEQYGTVKTLNRSLIFGYNGGEKDQEKPSS